ncbi:MAG: transcription elongation factor GreA [Chloroflexi bacterium]|nr:MAG: transcription elongation factor GreA [Anaerolineaceae bacterium 4572_32.2]RLC79291.1 MAG: transcription elongation factor GreA [Chloroflexota bacterium]RLC85140.1 MAG: transcription elongation factor GreA [Chloroflexota bacterium]HEY72220.1 transcription elongation factor GreA [Thermoflexia bacterium]
MSEQSQSTFLTSEGYQRLEQELEHLRKVRRQEVARRLHAALAEGDLIENAELEDARNEQSFVEGRILMLQRMLGSAVIIEEEGPRETVGLGSRVIVTEGNGQREAYHIVGSAEADPTKGLISNASPLGHALMGRKVGETAEVNAPAGVLVFKIVEIQ